MWTFQLLKCDKVLVSYSSAGQIRTIPAASINLIWFNYRDQLGRNTRRGTVWTSGPWALVGPSLFLPPQTRLMIGKLPKLVFRYGARANFWTRLLFWSVVNYCLAPTFTLPTHTPSLPLNTHIHTFPYGKLPCARDRGVWFHPKSKIPALPQYIRKFRLSKQLLMSLLGHASQIEFRALWDSMLLHPIYRHRLNIIMV